MTAEYQNTIGAGFDYLTAGTQPSEKGVAPAQRNTLRLYDKALPPDNTFSPEQKKQFSQIGYGEIVVNDFSQQGYNHPEGDFSTHSNGFAWSDLVTGLPNELAPAPYSLPFSSPDPTGNLVGLHGCMAFGLMIYGIGSGANVALYKETSTTDPTPVAITFSPAGSICSLTQVLAAGAERLAVGEVGQPVRLLSDAAGTVATTMDASTNSCWGIILSGINATTAGVPVMLIYAGTSITTKATDAVLTTATVATVPPTTVRAGGFAIGAIKAAGRAQRAYWGIPRVSNTSGALKYGAEALMDVMSTDMTGSDLLPLELKYLKNGIRGAVPYRDGLVAWDDTHIVYWDGDDEYDLGLFRRRTATRTTVNDINANHTRRIRSVCVDGPSLVCLSQTYDATATLPGVLIFEYYNYEAGTWHNQSSALTLTATTASVGVTLCGAGGMPLSQNTRRAHARVQIDSNWHLPFVPRPAESLIWQYNRGSGSTEFASLAFIAGNLLGCRWWLDASPPGSLPGTNTIKRAPKVITEVEFNGNLDYGYNVAAAALEWTLRTRIFGRGIDGTTTLTAYDETFTQGKPSADYRKKNAPTKRANIQDIQIYLSASGPANGPTTTTVASLLPLTIRFAYSKDGKEIKALPEDTLR